MSLEARLAALADDAFPPTPDLAAPVRARLGGQRNRRGRFGGPRVVAVLAALVLIPAGTVAAIEVWGPASPELRSVDRLPPAPPPAGTGGSTVATLAQAADRAGFEPRLPPFLDAEPRDIRVRRYMRTCKAGDATVTELEGSLIVEKVLAPGAEVERLTVDGAEAIFIRGEHDLVVRTADDFVVLPRRRVGDVLVYERDGIVIRVEGLTDPERFREPAGP